MVVQAAARPGPTSAPAIAGGAAPVSAQHDVAARQTATRRERASAARRICEARGASGVSSAIFIPSGTRSPSTMSGASPEVSPGPDVSVAVASDPRVSAAQFAAGLGSPLLASCRSCPRSASGVGHWVPSFVGGAAAPPAAGRSGEARWAIRSRTRSSSRPAPGGAALASASEPEPVSARNSARRSAIRPRSLPPRGAGSGGCPGAGDSVQLTPSGSVQASPGSGAAGRFSSTAMGGRSASTGTSSMATLTALLRSPSPASSIWKIDSGGGSQAAGPVTASANERPDTNAAATM